MPIITFRIDDELLELLDTYSSLKGITRSEAIRQAIKQYIEQAKQPPRIKIIKLER